MAAFGFAKDGSSLSAEARKHDVTAEARETILLALKDLQNITLTHRGLLEFERAKSSQALPMQDAGEDFSSQLTHRKQVASKATEKAPRPSHNPLLGLQHRLAAFSTHEEREEFLKRMEAVTEIPASFDAFVRVMQCGPKGAQQIVDDLSGAGVAEFLCFFGADNCPAQEIPAALAWIAENPERARLKGLEANAERAKKATLLAAEKSE